MPLHSMTGYGRAEREREGRRAAAEARSVNHRFLDVTIKNGGRMFAFDDRARRMVKERFHRGAFDITLSLASEREGARVRVNEELLKGYLAAAADVSRRFGVEYPPSFGDLLAVREMFTVGEADVPAEEAWPLVAEALAAALEQLAAMRAEEGRRLAEDMRGRFAALGALAARVRDEARTNAKDRYFTLRERVSRLLGETPLDEGRLAQEAAILADRADIEEELTRLDSHLAQAEAILAGEGPVGRKLEFLLQEINRETNTIGSKTPSLAVTNLVVEMKSEQEKIREQAQNLE